jgi:hypothetical protein
MSQIDSTFAGIPAPILAKWGHDITYLKTSQSRTYNPTTGAVSGYDVAVTIKAVISPVNSRESEGLYQSTDIKVIFGSAELGAYYPTEQDRLRYVQDGVTREAKIVSIRSYRGDNPVLHTVIARPQ